MIEVNEIRKRIKTYINYELQQNSKQALILMECIALIIELMGDEDYGQIVEDIFLYDLRQNPESALAKLKTIQLAIELETNIEG
jgi:hypothetical protein